MSRDLYDAGLSIRKPNEFKLHVKLAIRNGVSEDEIREVLLQVAIYAGVPAAVDGFRLAREALAELAAAQEATGP
jgi:4-carboxymuconolactone decarboxylase